MAQPWRGVLEEYREWLPVDEDTPVISLGEGGTPLVHSAWLSSVVQGDVWLKVEGDNPTGSFKDRGMTAAISVAVGEGAKAVVCASTGNTSASMTAYAARAGLTPIVLVPHGKIATGKMAQAVMHGAEVIQVRGGFDECLQLSRALADEYPVALVNSVNPVRLQGQKTAAFEIVDVLGDAPDVHVLPVGNAGNISAYWMGYREYADAGLATHRPRMWGFQAAGAAPLVRGEAVARPETVATAIRIGNPASWQLAIEARDTSGGRIDAVTDEQIAAWGWRVAFLMGAVGAVVVFWLRRSMDESLVETGEERRSGSMVELLTTYPKQLLLCFLITLGGTIAFYTYSVNGPLIIKSTYADEGMTGTWINFAALVLLMLIQPLGGLLSDRVGRKPLLVAFGIGGVLWTYTFLTVLPTVTTPMASFLMLAGTYVLLTGYTSINAVVKAELFPAHIRALGVGLGYALANSMFGGTAPLVYEAAISRDALGAFAVYVTIAIGVSLLVYVFALRNRSVTYLDTEQVARDREVVNTR